MAAEPEQERYIHLFYNTAALSVDRQPMSTHLELAEPERVEKALAIARVIFAVASALAIYVDTTQPFRYSALPYIILIGFSLYTSLIVISTLSLHDSLPMCALER